jgi:hypothetical protein
VGCLSEVLTPVVYELGLGAVGGWLGGAGAAASWLVGLIAIIPFIGSFAVGFFLGFKLG